MLNLNPTVRAYIVSSSITFVTTFLVTILPSISTLQPADFRNGAVAGLLFVGARAAIKAVIEYFVSPTPTTLG